MAVRRRFGAIWPALLAAGRGAPWRSAVALCLAIGSALAQPADPVAERRRFQSQELITARPRGWVFKPGDTPRLVWRDLEDVRQLGCTEPLRVRWFDAQLDEHPAPAAPGRWMAWIEGRAPNGTPLRRAFTLYALPPHPSGGYVPDLSLEFPRFPGPNAPAVVVEHAAEIRRVASDAVLRTALDSEHAAILFAGLAEFAPLGRPATHLESAAVLSADYQLALKLKLQGRPAKARSLAPLRRRDPPAPSLREGSPEETALWAAAKAEIDAICRAWAADTGEPFTALVAKGGLIVTHEAFGRDGQGQPIGRDYRCWIASLSKTVTAIAFSQFVDQGVVSLDDPVSVAFPDYPASDPQVPTFRQCFTHTSGLTGHGEFGGMFAPHFENAILNGLDVNRPGTRYEYGGVAIELVAKAMETLTGRSAPRLYHERLFAPLEFGDVPVGNASADISLTALELAKLGQWVANRGSYGALELVGPATFEQLLPRPLQLPVPASVPSEGIGLHWKRIARNGALAKANDELLLSPRTVGHGSFSGCLFFVDLDHDLVIASVRRQLGPRHGEWSARLMAAIGAALVPPGNR